MSECLGWVGVSDASLSPNKGLLKCWLPEDHDGPHYDEADDITWKVGKPDD